MDVSQVFESLKNGDVCVAFRYVACKEEGGGRGGGAKWDKSKWDFLLGPDRK